MKATIPSCLRTEFVRTRGNDSSFEIRARMPSEIEAISPLVDRMIRLIEESHCVSSEEPAVGLALREALSNAVLHGNYLDPCKLVQVHCRCELGYGVSIVVKDQGRVLTHTRFPILRSSGISRPSMGKASSLCGG